MYFIYFYFFEHSVWFSAIWVDKERKGELSCIYYGCVLLLQARSLFPSIHFLTPQSHLRAIMIKLYFLLLKDYHVLTVFRSELSFIYLFSFGLK